MTVPLTGTAGLFTRLGKLGALLKNSRSYVATQQTSLIDTTNGIVAQYNAESDLQALIGSAYIAQLNGINSTVAGLIQNVAEQTINRMIFRDNPQIAQNLQSLNIQASWAELIRQMKLSASTVLAMTIAATPSAFTGTGNGVVVTSVKRPIDGLVLENAYAETVLIQCNQDSYIGGAKAFNEGFSVTGAGAAGTNFDFNWPLGSGGSTQANAIDGSTDNGSGNILTNSDYESWTASVPNNYTITAGAATITKETTVVFSGAAALKLTGDGATQTSWQQLFNDATGTVGTLSPLTQYGVNLFLREASAIAVGVLTVDLIDGTNTVIKDANGVNNSFTVNLTALTTSYAGYNGVFRTPEIMPATYSIRYTTTTPITNTKIMYVDKCSLGVMGQLAVNDICLSVHSGSVPFVQGGGNILEDYATISVSNSRGAAGTLSTFQTLIWLLLQTAQTNEWLLPSAGSPSISDSLIA